MIGWTSYHYNQLCKPEKKEIIFWAKYLNLLKLLYIPMVRSYDNQHKHQLFTIFHIT